jgi:hypothetical protein
LALPAAALAQTGQTTTFELHINGKSFGKDVFTLAKAGKGYKLASHLTGSYRNNDLDYKDAITYDENFAFQDGSQNSQGTNQQTSYLPSKTRKEMTIANAAGGRTSSVFEAINGPDLIFLPPFDAGAAQALLLQAVNHPTANNHFTTFLANGYNAFANAGHDPTADPAAAKPEETLPTTTHSFDSVWVKGGPFTGTLDGKPVTLNTYALAFGKFRWIFFADEQNNLMQVNVTVLHAAYIREGFKLDPPKTPMPR